MCRRKQIFEGAKDFCPISPNLPEKFLCDFCLQIFSHRDHDDLLLVWPPEKGLYSFFCKRLAPCFKVKQCSTPILSRFSGILKRYLGILLEFQGVCQNFQGFCPYLWQINSFAGTLAPPAPPPPTPLGGDSSMVECPLSIGRLDVRSTWHWVNCRSPPWQESSPQPPRQKAIFRLRPAANCRHQNQF